MTADRVSGRGGALVNSGSRGPHLPGSCIREDINNLRSDDLRRETVQVQMGLRLERIGKRHARAIACENCYVEGAAPGWRQKTDADFAAFRTDAGTAGAYTLHPHLVSGRAK